jgi:6-phosphogluconate dehydrogenase
MTTSTEGAGPAGHDADGNRDAEQDAKYDVGLVGLAVMGENLALNIEEKGFSVAVYNRTPDKVDAFLARAGREGAKRVAGTKTPEDFVAALRRPRRIIMLVKAGAPVDETIAKLRPLLQPGDLLVDGGNEHFPNTERRVKEMDAAGLQYLGMGVSGGEEGARHGPSLMPGGHREAYDKLAPVLKKIAAQVEGPDGGPCVTYIGPGGAGHYVKMVHNGIEYGDMQLIAEAYDLLRSVGGLSNHELADVFAAWNEGELKSFLIEISARIFRTADPDGQGDLIDHVLDAAAQKGTGKWTVEDAAELGTPIPVIALSVEARVISAARAERLAAAKVLSGPPTGRHVGDKRQLIEDVKQALYCAKACSYAQGLRLLQVASNTRGWDLPLGEIAAIWRAGCIIRAQFLGRIKEAFDRDAKLTNLLLDPSFAAELAGRQAAWRRTVGLAAQTGVPLLCTSAALSYYDMIRRDALPANLIQAQRDLFGAHTYQRTDREGTFHSEWAK